MTNLATALVVVLQTMVPQIGQDRLAAVSEDMVSVVRDELRGGERLKSGIDELDAVAMLAAAAVHESGLREAVETCKLSGDGGRSIGLGQVMRGINWEGHSQKQICSSRKLQLRLALHVLERCWASTGTPSPAATFRCYAAGDPKRDSAAARDEYKKYVRVRRSLAGHPSDGPGPGPLGDRRDTSKERDTSARRL